MAAIGSRVVVLAMTLAAAACGHIGYGDDSVVGDDVTDAAVDAEELLPLHEYHLNGGYTDVYGGPDLVPLGGTRDANGYTYDSHGLSLTGAVPAQAYTIDLVFTPTMLTKYQKLINVKDRVADSGLYTFDDTLRFVVVAPDVHHSSGSKLSIGTQVQVTLTRTAAGVVQGFVDGHAVWTPPIDDDMNVASLPEVGAPVYFFADDTVTGGGESSFGSVLRIRIYDRPLVDIPP